MIYWKILFEDGKREDSTGYLVLDDNLSAVGVYDIKGTPVKDGVSYTTLTGDNEPPAWEIK